jgi:hypothetical protein
VKTIGIVVVTFRSPAPAHGRKKDRPLLAVEAAVIAVVPIGLDLLPRQRAADSETP